MRCFVTALCIVAASPLALGGGPQTPAVLSFSAADIDGRSVFEIVIARPDDMTSMTIEQDRRQTTYTVWPRFAELRGDPAWKFPVYLEWVLPEQTWRPVARVDRLTFVGRCGKRDALSLMFRYPVADGGWKSVPISLRFADAGEMKDAPSATTRWATAQANWFGALAGPTGDMGGFYAFAAQQTRRQHELPDAEPLVRPFRRRERPEEQLYNITTGALAVQESLQLDRMTATDRDRSQRTVPMKDIAAVTIRSHPFDTMRGDRQAIHGSLAGLTPHDFYYARFANVGKLMELLDFSDLWGTSLLRLTSASGEDYGVRERAFRQLCLPDSDLTRLLGPAVISEVAMVGSDPYLRDGSDFSVLLGARSKPALQAALEPFFSAARRKFPEASEDTIEHGGIAIQRLVDARRRVSCHRAWIANVWIYSNSAAAIKRIIDVHNEKRPSLADEPDFKYMRAVPLALEPEEDGFLYLSDAFIRHVVGPELRIKQKRRLEAVTSLKMLTNAVMFHGYQNGPGKPSMDDLIAAGSLNADDLYDPEGGVFTWEVDRELARNSVYGDLSFLTPLIEIDATKATQPEREQYEQFRDRYSRYWRNYFDPIGVRFKIGKTISVETYILPLIDLSEYGRFEDLAGGEPVEIDIDRFTDQTLLRWVMHLRQGAARQQALMFVRMFAGTNVATDWIGDWVTFWVEDTDAFHKLVKAEFDKEFADDQRQNLAGNVVDIFSASLVFGVHCKNKVSLAAFLMALRTMLMQVSPNTVVFNNLAPYKQVGIVQIAPTPNSLRQFGIQPEAATGEGETATQPAVSERGPALYYATIDDGFYLSTQAQTLRNLIDKLAAAEDDGSADRKSVAANVLLYAAPGAAEAVRPTVSLLLEHRARQASIRNMTQLWLLGRCGVLDERRLDQICRSYLGYRLRCPDGGQYSYDPAASEPVSSIHGPLSQPRRLDTPPEGSPLNRLLDTLDTVTARLEFTDDGLSTAVEIRRR